MEFEASKHWTWWNLTFSLVDLVFSLVDAMFSSQGKNYVSGSFKNTVSISRILLPFLKTEETLNFLWKDRQKYVSDANNFGHKWQWKSIRYLKQNQQSKILNEELHPQSNLKINQKAMQKSRKWHQRNEWLLQLPLALKWVRDERFMERFMRAAPSHDCMHKMCIVPLAHSSSFIDG